MDNTNKDYQNKLIYNNIKSIYIFKLIIKHLEITRFLNIIQYNKKLQKKFNTTINDYPPHAKIVIEIIPVQNKYDKYDTFFRIPKKYNQYYHIYFNDNKEEINLKRINEYIGKDKLTKIKTIIDYQVLSLEELFFDCKNIKKIHFIKCQRRDINNMNYMFNGCSSLEELNFSKFKTDK